jgi:Holliday junction DNA helicase RuvA
MIGRLRGVVAEKSHDGVLLDVVGVGYEMAVPPRALVELPGIGDDAVLHTHLHVREDAMALFGFASEDQRDLFRLLLGISGVGPKVALAILGTMTPDDLRRAVLTDDAAALTAVPGIGKRSAQKLLLELRPKLELPDTELAPSHSPLAEVRSALEGLGYQGDEIRVALAELPDGEEVEALLRQALQTLGRQS